MAAPSRFNAHAWKLDGTVGITSSDSGRST